MSTVAFYYTVKTCEVKAKAEAAHWVGGILSICETILHRQSGEEQTGEIFYFGWTISLKLYQRLSLYLFYLLCQILSKEKSDPGTEITGSHRLHAIQLWFKSLES